MRTLIIVALVALMAAPLATPASAGSVAGQLRLAKRALAAKQYERALRLFEDAVAQHPRSAWAHYEHARALARLRKQRKVCELDLYFNDVVERLQDAVELRPALKWKALRDRAFNELHGTALFHSWRGRDLRKGLRRGHVTGIDWHGLHFADRADWISFSGDGRVRYSHSVLPGGGKGTWRVARGQVEVRWVDGRKRARRFVLKASFDGQSAKLTYNGFHVASDQPDECNI